MLRARTNEQEGQDRRAVFKTAMIWSLLGLAAYAVLRTVFRLPHRKADSAPGQRPVPPSTLSRIFVHLAEDAERGSAIHPLLEGKSAFAARMMLIDLAEHAIDVQYYIWRDDLTGLLLLERLRAAAERGVRVRLLLDDNGAAGLDPILAELDAHPDIAVRLYNPFVIRRPRLLNYLFDFLRLNRRMHNKSITYDGALTITGGRNIGDEYFDTGDNPLFVDLDVIAAGEAARAVAGAFELYWNSRSAYRLGTVVPLAVGKAGALETALAEKRRSAQFQRFSEAMASDPITRDLVERRLTLEPARALLVCDAPDKTLGSVLSGDLLVGQLKELLDEVEHRLDLVSPYFVPGKQGVAEFLRLARRGAKVRVLTNSLEANDVALVHAGYRKYRRRLLKGGVELLELKAGSAPPSRGGQGPGIGSSGSSLHAKTFSADGRLIFIGSFNFDPRSVWLNTEMGLVIESEGLAGRMHTTMENQLADRAYRVSLDARGRMQWEDRETGEVFRSDPHSGIIKRAAIFALGLLPIEWLL
ncbi:MAG: phospholipase D family protein [Erythrobacter sp.]|jgi:putative cardiolipin synthase|nr:phospholipase D family protein [Erythrobacter sp.]